MRYFDLPSLTDPSAKTKGIPPPLPKNPLKKPPSSEAKGKKKDRFFGISPLLCILCVQSHIR